MAGRFTGGVTGRGIGAAAARAFAAAGARVALVGRSRNALADLAGELGGDRALAIPCDVSRYWEMDAAVEATVLEQARELESMAKGA